jgi:hypothetical protein
LRRVVVERVAERHLFRRDLVTGVRDRCGWVGVVVERDLGSHPLVRGHFCHQVVCVPELYIYRTALLRLSLVSIALLAEILTWIVVLHRCPHRHILLATLVTACFNYTVFDLLVLIWHQVRLPGVFLTWCGDLLGWFQEHGVFEILLRTSSLVVFLAQLRDQLLILTALGWRLDLSIDLSCLLIVVFWGLKLQNMTIIWVLEYQFLLSHVLLYAGLVYLRDRVEHTAMECYLRRSGGTSSSYPTVQVRLRKLIWELSSPYCRLIASPIWGRISSWSLPWLV